MVETRVNNRVSTKCSVFWAFFQSWHFARKHFFINIEQTLFNFARSYIKQTCHCFSNELCSSWNKYILQNLHHLLTWNWKKILSWLKKWGKTNHTIFSLSDRLSFNKWKQEAHWPYSLPEKQFKLINAYVHDMNILWN